MRVVRFRVGTDAIVARPLVHDPLLTQLQLVKKGHQLLVTLLLMNAAAMEARLVEASPHTSRTGGALTDAMNTRTRQTLPLFLDQLTNPVGAILISVTMVLVFGESMFTAGWDSVTCALTAETRALLVTQVKLCRKPSASASDWLSDSIHDT